VARDQMAGWLEAVSTVLPLTYAYDARARATRPGSLGTRFAVDVIVIVTLTLGALAARAATMRRRSG
jgi:ABC-2 type transport system permease protein